jgi:hypothetical protein
MSRRARELVRVLSAESPGTHCSGRCALVGQRMASRFRRFWPVPKPAKPLRPRRCVEVLQPARPRSCDDDVRTCRSPGERSAGILRGPQTRGRRNSARPPPEPTSSTPGRSQVTREGHTAPRSQPALAPLVAGRTLPGHTTRRSRRGAVLTRRIENPFLPHVDSGLWAITAKHG